MLRGAMHAHQIPSTAQVRLRLKAMSTEAVRQLSLASRVPYTTIWKVRDGTTANPGLETVRQILAFMPAETIKSTGNDKGDAAADTGAIHA